MKLASITAITVATSLAVALARAQAVEPRKDEPHTLAIQVGGTVKLCKTGTIVCPACAVICDDLSVAAPEYGGPDGLEIRGVGPGTTLCSAAASCGMERMGARVVYRVLVTRGP